MNPLSEIFPSLMRWREPNAYIRKTLARGRWIGLLIVLLIAPVGLITSPSLSKGIIILASVFMVVGVLGFIRVWFGPGNVVCLKEDYIVKASGSAPRKSSYKYILSCDVRPDSYNNTNFSILNFTVKKGLPPGQVEKVVVPNDVNLEQVVQILRGKGVKVITEHS
ncbi:MAG: hypothetical protein ACREDQ_04975 [Limisphaerales bacterium]